MSEPAEPSRESGFRCIPGILFGVAILVSALGNCWVGLYPYGTAVWVRPLFSILGIAGAILIFVGSAWWRVLLPIWCLLQMWIIATDVSGPWFYQGMMLGHFSSSSAKVNEVTIEYKASGVNYSGLVLLLILAMIATLRLHPAIYFHITRKWFVGVIVTVLLVVCTMLWLNSWPLPSSTSDAITLKLDLPRVPIYYRDKLLGHTPIKITPQRVDEWNLPLQAGAQFKAFGSGWADVVILTDGTTKIPLYAGVPAFFSSYLDRFPTPWGERCRMQISHEDQEGRNLSGYLYRKPELRNEPLLTISFLDQSSVEIGQPVRVHVVLSNPTSRTYTGREVKIEQHCFYHIASQEVRTGLPTGYRRDVTMPASWNNFPPGSTLTADLEFAAPVFSSSYEFFCTWFMYDPDPPKNTGVGSCYSNIMVLQVRDKKSM
jgi:hypothetical protein